MIFKARVSSITRRPPSWDGEDQFDVHLEGRLPDLSRMGKIDLQLTGLTEAESAVFLPGYRVNVALVPNDERMVPRRSERWTAPA